MEKILNQLTKISKDKLLHFFYGFFISLVVLLLLPKLIACLSVLFLAVLKEAYDKHNNGTVEVLDIVFSCLPLLMLLLII